MTIFEENLMNFVLEGVPFEDFPLSDVKVTCTGFHGTRTILLTNEYTTYTFALKPAFSDVWLISYDCVEGGTENYVEVILHRILAMNGKKFQYM